MMTKLFADRLSSEGILVNEICPGIIYTEMTEKVNEILAKALAAGYYETWYEEALNTAGVEISYDADGNPIED